MDRTDDRRVTGQSGRGATQPVVWRLLSHSQRFSPYRVKLGIEVVSNRYTGVRLTEERARQDRHFTFTTRAVVLPPWVDFTLLHVSRGWVTDRVSVWVSKDGEGSKGRENYRWVKKEQTVLILSIIVKGYNEGSSGPSTLTVQSD